MEVSLNSSAKQRQRNVLKKRALHVAFLLIRPIVVFFTVLVAFAA